MGWSYGGYMTSWTITQTTRFKAASVGAGVTNLYSMYGTTDIPEFLDRYFAAKPWNDIATYQKHSAMFQAKNIRTPTLIQHGEADDRVPLAQGKELYVAIKMNNVPVEFAVYPRQGHLIMEPKLQYDMLSRNLNWFNRWLKGTAP
jgi:dipeptidyl aminopeptidase/acylaminoacyl peptidase